MELYDLPFRNGEVKLLHFFMDGCLAETTMFRLKTIFSERVTAHGFAGQAAQLLVRCAALNRMTTWGSRTATGSKLTRTRVRCVFIADLGNKATTELQALLGWLTEGNPLHLDLAPR